MKLFIPAFLIMAVLSCEKDAYDSPKFTYQTYSGKRIIYYQLVDHTTVDTVTNSFNLKRYEYSGKGYMDYGYGSYLNVGLDFIRYVCIPVKRRFNIFF
jgi:hypothetical protein